METDRILLRKFTLNDVEESWKMNSDPKVTEYIPFEGPTTLEQVKKLIQENTLADYKKYGFGRLAMVLKESGEFMGFHGLKYLPEHNAVDLGYRMKTKFWGKGYATEAGIACMNYGFNHLNLEKIQASAYKSNRASIRVMEKLGMGYEKDMIEEGETFAVYSVTKQKWKSLKLLNN